MTCEVIAMNRLGAALAADGAVTIDGGKKIYHHAQKLFSLAPGTPVGIMISGVPEIMGVPWQTVIEAYARELGERRFDTLAEYAEDFRRFMEASTTFFPPDVQRDWFQQLVENYWREEFAAPLAEVKKQHARGNLQSVPRTLMRLVQRKNATWRRCSEKELGLLQFKSPSGEQILADYGDILDRLERFVFHDQALSRNIRLSLRATVRFMYDKPWFHRRDRSYVEFVGFGETEPFPVYQEYMVGSIASGQLRWAKLVESRVAHDASADLHAPAQNDAVAMFMNGIAPALDAWLENAVVLSVARKLGSKQSRHSLVAKARNEFRRRFNRQIELKCRQPIMAAMDGMPLLDLADFAEALVRLEAFRKRVSVEEKETVDTTITAAILSRGEGFRWVLDMDRDAGPIAKQANDIRAMVQ